MKKIIYTIVLSALGILANAQGVGIGTPSPVTSSILELKSTNKGFLMPRMTTLERVSIASPAAGLQVYDTTTNSIWFHNGIVWVSLKTPIRTVTADTALSASDNGGFVYVNTSGATTVTIPALSEAFHCVIVQKGTGQVTISGSGATLTTARGTKTRAQYSAVGIIFDTTTTDTITGDAIN